MTVPDQYCFPAAPTFDFDAVSINFQKHSGRYLPPLSEWGSVHHVCVLGLAARRRHSGFTPAKSPKLIDFLPTHCETTCGRHWWCSGCWSTVDGSCGFLIPGLANHHDTRSFLSPSHNAKLQTATSCCTAVRPCPFTRFIRRAGSRLRRARLIRMWTSQITLQTTFITTIRAFSKTEQILLSWCGQFPLFVARFPGHVKASDKCLGNESLGRRCEGGRVLCWRPGASRSLTDSLRRGRRKSKVKAGRPPWY